jgi:hypothetical protein
MRLIHLAAIAAALAFAVSPALAGKGGNGQNTDAAPASCSVADGIVSATGLPTGEVINFMVTDGSGDWGWVLGFRSTVRRASCWAPTTTSSSPSIRPSSSRACGGHSDARARS